MKTFMITASFILCGLLGGNMLFATPDTWTQKADFGGGVLDSAVGFSIGSKGYIGPGWDGVDHTNSLWEYNPASNTWTQKADFGGDAREYAAAFSIGTKGYVGTGWTGSVNVQDFWEYDSVANSWTQKANFGGTARDYAAGFSIGTKGYIGTGWNATEYADFDDFWEYSAATNTWTQKANFVGTARDSAVAFSIAGKGYLGTGWDETSAGLKDFWEYDPASDTWSQKVDFGGPWRYSAAAFSLARKGYIGTGSYDQDSVLYADFWEYDPSANTWTQKADFGGEARGYAVGFAIGGKGYIGTGWNDASGSLGDFWQYEAASPFSDVASTYWAYDHIMSIYNRGYSSGYGSATLFAPELSVTREQMAAFIVRAKEGEPASNYCSTGSAFPDVTAADWSCGYIKRLYELGLTTGYGTTGYFMPSYAVTREQMAAFLIRAIEGNPASNYCDSGSPFTDVTAADWSCIYIKRLYELAITTGYGDGTYGPYDLVTRAQMAVFLGRAFLGME